VAWCRPAPTPKPSSPAESPEVFPDGGHPSNPQVPIGQSAPAVSSNSAGSGHCLADFRQCQPFGDHSIGDCDLRKINLFTISLSDAGLGPATVNIHLKALKTFLRWANEMGQLERMPKIPMLRGPKKYPAVLSLEEISRLMERLINLRNMEAAPKKTLFYRLHQRFLMVALETGMRRGEIFWLPWEQIDLETGTISFRIQTRFMIKEKKKKWCRSRLS